MQRKIDLALRSNYGNKRNLSTIKYIVIHYTANDGDSDEANGNYFDDTYRGASAHYFVDDDSITQTVPDDYVAYSVGGSKYNNAGGRLHGVATNANTLNIEMCDTVKDGRYNVSEKTLANTIALVKEKQTQYGIPDANVIRHYDVNGKPCPAYYVDENAWATFKARLAGGWVQDSVGWWYRNADGSYPVNSWKLVDGQWYYFNEKGYMVTGWKQINSTWYYLEESGKMHIGWLDLNGTWYYLNQDGVMLTNWQLIDGTWYYFNTDGVMQTDWQLIEGQWYYFDTNGKMFASKWITSKGKDYYLTASGAMATSCYVKSASANIYYWVNKDGVWEPEWNTSTPNLTKYYVAV